MNWYRCENGEWIDLSKCYLFNICDLGRNFGVCANTRYAEEQLLKSFPKEEEASAWLDAFIKKHFLKDAT